MTETRALVVTEPGSVEVLAVQDRTIEAPGEGQLLVRVAAAGVNFIDVYYRQGVYQRPPPFILGEEGAGRVLAVGPGVTGVEIGDAVAWASGSTGSMAELTVVDAAKAVPVPADVDADTAAAAMLQGMTAHYLVTSTHPIAEGEAVLIHAAAGGVGQLLVQLALRRGATVIATVSTPEKAEIVRELGAQTVICYGELADEQAHQALADRVRAASGGQGVRVAYDGVGRATFETSLRSLGLRGLLALFGAASGQVPPFDLQRLNSAGGLFVTRPSLGHYTATREELLWRGTEVLSLIADGSLKVAIGGRYPLAEAPAAYQALEGRRSTGKLLITP